MGTRTTITVSSPLFVVDQKSLVQNQGVQVDFDSVPDSYKQTNSTKKLVKAGTVMSTLASSSKVMPRLDTIGAPSGITRSGSTATLTLTAHGFATGDKVTISGSDQTEYNGEFVITVTDANTFTYTVTGTPATPSTGTLASHVVATCILLTNANEDSKSDALTGYGAIIGGVLFENVLPDATGSPKELPAAYKTELEAAGTGFAYAQYSDSR